MAFDINDFMQGQVAEPMATAPENVPEGTFKARIAEIESPDEIATKWIMAPRGNMTWPKLTIPFVILDEAVMKQMGRTKPPVVRSDFRLDVVEGGSSLLTGPGKNVDLGKLRAALGLNQPGVPFTWTQLPGAGPVMVTVKHQENAREPGNPYVKVVRVAPCTE